MRASGGSYWEGREHPCDHREGSDPGLPSKFRPINSLFDDAPYPRSPVIPFQVNHSPKMSDAATRITRSLRTSQPCSTPNALPAGSGAVAWATIGATTRI